MCLFLPHPVSPVDLPVNTMGSGLVMIAKKRKSIPRPQQELQHRPDHRILKGPQTKKAGSVPAGILGWIKARPSSTGLQFPRLRRRGGDPGRDSETSLPNKDSISLEHNKNIFEKEWSGGYVL